MSRKQFSYAEHLAGGFPSLCAFTSSTYRDLWCRFGPMRRPISSEEARKTYGVDAVDYARNNPISWKDSP